MEKVNAFIEYLADFTINIILYDRQGLKDAPVYKSSILNWEIDPSVKSLNFSIEKGNYGSSLHFLFPNLFETIEFPLKVSYYKHLQKLFDLFKIDLQNEKHNISDHVYASRLLEFKTQLENLSKQISKKIICLNPESSKDSFHEFSYVKDAVIHFSNGRPIKSGFIDFLTASMIEDQILVMEEVIGFLKEETRNNTVPKSVPETVHDRESNNTVEEDIAETEEKHPARIKFLDDVNILVTLLYDLKSKNYIHTSNVNIVRFLHHSFSDKNGVAININTADTILKKEEKRALIDKRIKVQDR